MGRCWWMGCVAAAVVVAAGGMARAQTVAVFKQVNTNAAGNDIVGDAANEPSLAVDPKNPNRIVMGWRQFDTVTSGFKQAGVAYSSDGGLTWTRNVLTVAQTGTDPVVRADADGNFYYTSVNSPQAMSTITYKSTDGGVSWSSAVDSHGGDKPWVAIDRTSGPGRGNVYEMWDGTISFTGGSFTRSTNGGASFETPLSIPTPAIKWGTMDVGATSTLYMAGESGDETGILFAKSTNVQFAGQTPAFTTSTTVPLGGTVVAGGSAVNPDGLMGQVWLAYDRSQTSHGGDLYVLASVASGGSGPTNVMFTRSTDDGATWSSPLRINNDAIGTGAEHWFGTMSVAPDGRIDVIWNDTRNDPNQLLSQLFYAYSVDGGVTWLGNIPVAPAFDSTLGDAATQDKIGDYIDMTSDDGGADIAFTATYTGGQDVYFLRIAAPEPGSLMLLAAGAGMVCWGGRRSRLRGR